MDVTPKYLSTSQAVVWRGQAQRSQWQPVQAGGTISVNGDESGAEADTWLGVDAYVPGITDQGQSLDQMMSELKPTLKCQLLDGGQMRLTAVGTDGWDNHNIALQAQGVLANSLNVLARNSLPDGVYPATLQFAGQPVAQFNVDYKSDMG